MNGLNMGYVGILIQGFAFFVAVSIFLGRIYFLKYFETLGIPASAARQNIIDYSVVSPDVAVLGIGIAIVGAALVLIARRPRQGPNWNRIVIGILLVAAGIVGKYLLPL